MKIKEIKPLTRPEALEKLKTYCAYQERSKKQVTQKMQRLHLHPDWFEGLIRELQSANYLDITRFADSFARGKSRGRGWGEQKIRQRLQYELGVDFVPDQHLASIDTQAAIKRLLKDLSKKKEVLLKKDDKNLKRKLLRFCISRGFGVEDAMRILKAEFGL